MALGQLGWIYGSKSVRLDIYGSKSVKLDIWL